MGGFGLGNGRGAHRGAVHCPGFGNGFIVRRLEAEYFVWNQPIIRVFVWRRGFAYFDWNIQQYIKQFTALRPVARVD